MSKSKSKSKKKRKKTMKQRIIHTLFHNRVRSQLLLYMGVFAALGVAYLNFSGASGTAEVQVRARGSTGAERIELKLQNQTVQSWDLSTDWATLTYSSSVEIGDKDLRIAFVNDGNTASGADKNVEVDYVVVNGSTFQTESPIVYSEGSWNASTGCNPGNKSSQWLHCMGFFEYTIGDAGELVGNPNDGVVDIVVRARGTVGDENIELLIKDVVVASWDLTTAFQNLSYTHNEAVEDTDIKVNFTNNSTSISDSNAVIDHIEVNGQTFASEDPSVWSTGSWRGGNCDPGYKERRLLHCQGYFQFSIGDAGTPIIDPEPEDTVEVSIRAKGDTGEEQLDLLIRNSKIATFDLSTSYQTFTYTSDSAIGDTEIKVRFPNDGFTSSGQDKNAHIDFIEVGTSTFQSEDPSVFSIGSWNAATGCVGGNKQSETLHCRGYMHYSIGNAGQFEGEPVDDPFIQVCRNDVEITIKTSERLITDTDPPCGDDGGGEDPVAGHNGLIGCRSNCQTAGYQNLDNASNMVIENMIISNPNGKCMSLVNAQNITVRNVTFENCANNTELSGRYHNAIIPADNSRNIRFENVRFSNLSQKSSADERNNLFHLDEVDGFVLTNSEVKDLHSDIFLGGGQDDFGNRVMVVEGSSKNITIEKSTFLNAGRNILQLSFNGDQPGIVFQNNRVEGRGPNDSDYEDMINTYASGGAASSPMLIKGNYFRYGGPSQSGTAAILGDSGAGKPVGSNIHAIDNVLVSTGHAGFGIYGGENHRLEGNIIFSGIEPPDNNAAGIFVFREDTEYGADWCRNNFIVNNRVWFKNSFRGGTNDYYIEGGRLGNNVACENNTISGNTWADTSLNEADIWPF